MLVRFELGTKFAKTGQGDGTQWGKNAEQLEWHAQRPTTSFDLGLA